VLTHKIPDADKQALFVGSLKYFVAK